MDASPTLESVAVMGGSYGNVPALQACIQDARRKDVQTFAFIGDAIGCCGHSDETITLIRDTFDVLVSGNHEQQAASGATSCACGYESEEDERISCLAFKYALDSLSEENRKWLGTWPTHRVISSVAGRIMLCHGSPDETNEFLYESTVSDDRLRGWLDREKAVGLVCTHTGIPWLRRLGNGRFAANCGVVGKPDHDGEPAVHYLLLNAGQGPHGGGVRPEIRRVTYDHESWASQLEQEGVDDVFVRPLRTGIWTCGVDSLPAAERKRAPVARSG